VRTVLVCVRSAAAAQAITVYAGRVGAGTAVRTALTGAEAMARLAERAADTILVDTLLARPDPVGFVRRMLSYAPGATVVLVGPEDSQVAAAAVAAGARGMFRSGDQELVSAVTRSLLMLCLPGRAPNGAARDGGAAREAGPAGATARAGAPEVGAADAGAGVPPVRANGAGEPDQAARPEPGVPAEPTSGTGAAVATGTGLVDETRETLVPAQREEDGVRIRRPALTERELQVLRGMADGKSNAEIGRDLFVSEDTVKTHARRLFRKLGARDRAHAVAAGFRTGLVS
jgi:DNA-binding NarL/FixJ family response regulator